MKRISVIIPVYNHVKALRASLASLRAQSRPAQEVILVDDGSDTPLSEVLPLSELGLPVQCIRKTNGGAPSARNRGFAESAGEYVIFWDADVIAKPTMLEKMEQVLSTHADVGFAYADHSFGRVRMTAQPFSHAALKKQNYIHSTSLVRRNCVVPWDESLRRLQDWDFWLTLSDNGVKGGYIPEELFNVIPHRTGISTWLPRRAYQDPWRRLPIIRRHVQRYEDAVAIVRKKHALAQTSSTS